MEYKITGGNLTEYRYEIDIELNEDGGDYDFLEVIIFHSFSDQISILFNTDYSNPSPLTYEEVCSLLSSFGFEERDNKELEKKFVFRSNDKIPDVEFNEFCETLLKVFEEHFN